MVKSRRVALSTSALIMGAGVLAAMMLVPTASAATGQGAGCTASVHVDAQWGSGASAGQVVTVTVTNTAASAGTRWTVTAPLSASQHIVSAWNATVTASADTLTAVNQPYNGALGAGATTTFGMQLAGPTAAFAFSCANDATLPSPSTSSSPSASSSPSTGPDITVGEADNGKTVTLLLGQRLGVSLPSTYDPTLSSSNALASLSSSGGYVLGQPFTATYLAIESGSFNLTSEVGAPCCTVPTQVWKVYVQVVDASIDHTVAVTHVSNHSTVSLHVGDVLWVSLPAMFPPPAVSGGVLVPQDVTGGYPSDQPMIAHYLANAPGQLDLSTLSDIACNHGPTPCPHPREPWTVHVIVTP